MENLEKYKSYKKSPFKSIKHNTYFECYDHFFSKYRGKKITFVEIGVLGGGSLFMWRDYFGEKARTIGVDLNKDLLNGKIMDLRFILAINQMNLSGLILKIK